MLTGIEAGRLRLYHIAIPTEDPQNRDNMVDYAAKVPYYCFQNGISSG